MMPTLRVDILDDIIGLAKDLTDSLSKKLESFRCTGRTIDMEIEFRRITLQVIGAAVLSLSSEECDRVFPELYLEAIEECNKRIMQRWRKFLPIPAFFQFQDKIRRLDKYIKTICRERWRKRKQEGNKGTGDILDRILQAIEENGGKWNSGLETQLCYEIKTFLLAGHETSAEMLTWALCELTQHEKYLDRVVEEADSVFGAQEAIPPRRAVDGMTFTLAVLKEVLRCHTLVPIVTRMFVGDEDELMGRKIPKGTMVVTHLEGTHKLYKDPLKFDPHRFLPGGEYDQFDEVIRPFMFVPFIQGPRNCLGQHLALLEGRVVLSLLLKRFRFKPVRNGPAKPRGVIPVCPEGGMRVYVN